MLKSALAPAVKTGAARAGTDSKGAAATPADKEGSGAETSAAREGAGTVKFGGAWGRARARVLQRGAPPGAGEEAAAPSAEEGGGAAASTAGGWNQALTHVLQLVPPAKLEGGSSSDRLGAAAKHANKEGDAAATAKAKEVASKVEPTPTASKATNPRALFGPGDAPLFADGDVGAAYWEARYSCSAHDSFDWYMDPETVGPVLKKRLPSGKRSAELLEAGCGTSELAAWLHGQGWKLITGIDSSAAAIAKARGARRHATKPELQFMHMDACHLSFPDSCFDAVYEKALFDTLLTGGQAVARAAQYLEEVHRVLRSGGVFILVSHGSLAVRLPWFAFNPAWNWSIEMCKLPKPPPPFLGSDAEDADEGAAHSKFFHVYVLTKRGGGGFM